MKYILALTLTFLLFSCSADNDELIKDVSVKLKFTQNWDGTLIEKSDLNKTEFTNKFGSKLTIEKLRYLISDVALINGANDTTSLNDYKLFDSTNIDSLTYTFPEKIPEGSYRLFFTFGFAPNKNISNAYNDLNSASWNLPDSLGGGYHFMQIAGKFKDTLGVQNPYKFYMARAYDKKKDSLLNTSFSIETAPITLKNNATVEVKMNIAGWFKSPNDWNLNEKNTDLTADFEAQKDISENGQSGVFSLGTISQ